MNINPIDTFIIWLIDKIFGISAVYKLTDLMYIKDHVTKVLNNKKVSYLTDNCLDADVISFNRLIS